MTAATEAPARTYRLSPPDRTGWMFGLSLVQLLVVAVGVVAGTVLMAVGAVLAGLVVMVLDRKSVV